MRILAFFCFPVKKMKKKSTESVQNIGNIFPLSVYARILCVLYSNFRDSLSVSLIFFRDILARECESDDRYEESEESNPEIRINIECRYRIESRFSCSCGELIRGDGSGCGLDNDFLMRRYAISLDEEEWDGYHRYSESEDRPFPDLFSKYSWIENPTNKTNTGEKIENIDEFRRNSRIAPVCLLNSEGDDKKENKGKSYTDKADRLICWFFLNQLNKLRHIGEWEEIMNTKIPLEYREKTREFKKKSHKRGIDMSLVKIVPDSLFQFLLIPLYVQWQN